MYQTSDNYRSKIYEASTKHVLKVYINDTKVKAKDILDCKISQILFSNDEFELGTVTSKSVELKLYKTAIPSAIESISIKSGIEGEIIPIRCF